MRILRRFILIYITYKDPVSIPQQIKSSSINPLNPELNPICYLLALLAHHFLHVSRIRVKSLTLRLLMSYIYIFFSFISNQPLGRF